MSSTELEALVCGAKALKVLRIRHVCPLDSGFAERIARACSTLEELVLDKCDFKMGIESVGMQPFAKLRFIQVSCRVQFAQMITKDGNKCGQEFI